MHSVSDIPEKNNSFIHTGLVIPIDETDVDTDKIIPALFLTTVVKKGLGKHLFDRVRKENARAYPVDDPKYRDASIMLCRPNFGCGSSREHAVWAIQDAGFKVLVGTTFLDIFVNNAQLNGLWIIQVAPEIMNRLFLESKEKLQTIRVNMADKIVQLPWDEDYSFDVDPFYEEIFTKGLDPIRFVSEGKSQQIRQFENRRKANPTGVFVV